MQVIHLRVDRCRLRRERHRHGSAPTSRSRTRQAFPESPRRSRGHRVVAVGAAHRQTQRHLPSDRTYANAPATRGPHHASGHASAPTCLDPQHDASSRPHPAVLDRCERGAEHRSRAPANDSSIRPDAHAGGLPRRSCFLKPPLYLLPPQPRTLPGVASRPQRSGTNRTTHRLGMHAGHLSGIRDRQQRRLSRCPPIREPRGDQVRQTIDRRRRQLVKRTRIQRYGRPRRDQIRCVSLSHHAASSSNDSCRGPSHTSTTSLHRNTT